ncbi:MAG: cellulase family glycosylhydrolase [Bacteroidales bacterium]
MNNYVKAWISGIVLLGIVSFSLPACKSGTPAKEYIKVKNHVFYSGREQYYPVGVNMWYAAYLGAESVDGGRERLCRELDVLQENGINNIRILGASEQSDMRMGLSWGMQVSPGKYNEELLAGLDFFLSELGKRKLYAIIFLNNYWQWSGGMSQYMAWQGKELIDPDATGDWHGFMRRSAEFYSSDSANRYFREYIRMLIERKNTITGKLYKDDPSIMSWQLANEPRPGPDGEAGMRNREVFIRWIDETASYIKSLDPNHLVSTGNEGLAGCIQDSAIFVDAHRSAAVDYLTFHLWPKNWGWFNALQPEATFDTTLFLTKIYLDRHLAMAALLDKPIVLEEFGMERDSGKTGPASGTSYRDLFYKEVLVSIAQSIHRQQPLAGFNLWAWGGIGIPATGKFNLNSGQDYMGDPLQEPQGLNSVMATDTSTLRIIRKFAEDIQIH